MLSTFNLRVDMAIGNELFEPSQGHGGITRNLGRLGKLLAVVLGYVKDVPDMLRAAIRQSEAGRSGIAVGLLAQDDRGVPKRVRLRPMCGPGDDLQPVSIFRRT
jgi:hypothetical protein